MKLRALLAAGWLALAACASAYAANLTPDQLTAATTANNTDLFLIYPAGGPMKSLQWSVVKALMQATLGTAYLQVTNNLSDLGSPTAARTNLNLGSAALQNTGTSGANVPLLSQSSTWSGSQTIEGGAAGVGLNIDSNAGFIRQLLFNSAGLARWVIVTTGTPETGSNVGSDFAFARFADAGAFIDEPIAITRSTGLVTIADGLTVSGGIAGALTGNASTATALATGRTIAITGDLTYTSPSFTGAGNVTGPGTLATVNGNVGSFTNANVTVNAKGLITAAANGNPGLTAYANVTCTSGGCAVAAGSVNVTSVTRNSAGNYTVNFTASYGDTHYVPVVGSGLAIFMSVTSMANASVTVAFVSATDGQFFIHIAGT